MAHDVADDLRGDSSVLHEGDGRVTQGVEAVNTGLPFRRPSFRILGVFVHQAGNHARVLEDLAEGVGERA